MKHLTVRLLLAVAAIAALGAAGYQAWQLDRQQRTESQRRSEVADRLRSLTMAVAELRTEQQAYVAAGQGSDFWAAKVTQVLARVEKELADVTPLVATPEARTALDETANAIGTFRKLDARARDYARSSQTLIASDLIFSDGFETTAAALGQLETARLSEAAAGDTAARDVRWAQLQVLGGAAAFCALVVLALTPRVKAARAADADDAEGAMEPPASATPADAVTIAESAPSGYMPDLAAAADVCAGFARVLESSELTALLVRAAQVINAAGMIIWVADRTGAELRPALAYGYSHQTLARMGAIPRDAHNAVAAAYRTGGVRTVSADAVQNGAIVAPIVSPGGCLGVLAAEIRGGDEHNEAVKALAMVFASQLGTLVSSVPADGSSAVSQAQA